MYDCEGEISNDANINRIYDKYVQEQMPQRDEVKTAITEYLTEECGESPEEAKEIAESRIRGIEDYSGMIDYCC